LVLNERLGFFDGGGGFLRWLVESQPDDFTGFGIEFPEADKAAAIGDGVAGEVGDVADVGVEIVGIIEERCVVAAMVDESVNAGEEADLGFLGGFEGAERVQVLGELKSAENHWNSDIVAGPIQL